MWGAIGAGLLVLPLLPIPRWSRAPDPGPQWTNDLYAWGLGLVVTVVLAVALGWLVRRRAPRLRWSARHDRALITALAVGLTAATAVTAWTLFSVNPHLIDEMAQLLHARAFAAGRLTLPSPEPASAFVITHTFVTEAGWVSQYPPGHTVLLALGFLLRAEWLVGPLLGGASLVGVYLIARGLYGPRVARAAAVLWALSAWVLFMSATYLNHVGAVALAVFAWALVLAPGTVGRWRLALAGAAIVATTAARPLDGVAACIPLAVWLVSQRRWSAALWMAVGGAPLVLGWAYFNWRLFGAPWAMGYTELYGPEHGMGFHVDPWGQPFTPFVALSNLAVAVRRLHSYLYEWPIPALLPLGLWALVSRRRRRRDAVLGAALVSVPVLYFFYWHSGYYLGPRFYYFLAPWLVIGTACAWRWGRGVAATRSRRLVDWGAALAVAGVVVVTWGFASVFPNRWTVYREGLPSFKLHPERELASAGIERGVVLIPTSWGNRVVADLWSLGVGPGLVERAYRRVDLCRLDRVRRHARAESWTADSITSAVQNLAQSQRAPSPLVPGWPDPTLRLTPGAAVSEECRVELVRDLAGVGTYENLAWRNAAARDRGLVFARDLYERNEELFAQYPGWPFWRYVPPQRPGGEWVLQPIAAP